MESWKEDNLINFKEEETLNNDGGLKNFCKKINCARKELEEKGKTIFLGHAIEYENKNGRKTGYVMVDITRRYRGWEPLYRGSYPLEDIFQDIVWEEVNNIFKKDIMEDWEFDD